GAMLSVLQNGPHGHLIAEGTAVFVNQEHTAARITQQSPFGSPANELRIELLKIDIIDGPYPPHFAAGHKEHAAGAIKLASNIKGLQIVDGGIWIAKTRIHAAAGLGVFDGVIAAHTVELAPGAITRLGAIVEPQKFSRLAVIRERQRPRFFG